MLPPELAFAVKVRLPVEQSRLGTEGCVTMLGGLLQVGSVITEKL